MLCCCLDLDQTEKWLVRGVQIDLLKHQSDVGRHLMTALLCFERSPLLLYVYIELGARSIFVRSRAWRMEHEERKSIPHKWRMTKPRAST